MGFVLKSKSTWLNERSERKSLGRKIKNESSVSGELRLAQDIEGQGVPGGREEQWQVCRGYAGKMNQINKHGYRTIFIRKCNLEEPESIESTDVKSSKCFGCC